jgi:hypothetical protein
MTAKHTSSAAKAKLQQSKIRHPESPLTSQRFLQLASRGEGSCASSLYRLAIKKQFICVPVGSQVFPIGIEECHELVFLWTPPALDFFLACNGEFNIREPLEICETITFVFCCESTTQSVLVLPHPLFHRGAHTCLKRAPGRVGHHINMG